MNITIHRLSRLSSATFVLLIGLWLEGREIAAAKSRVGAVSKERWAYTTNSHFSWYALLALSPIYRDQLRSVLLDTERLYSALVMGRSGVLFPQAADVQFLALGRARGDLVWERRLPFNGYPIAGQLISVGGRLVAALFEQQTKDIIILGMDPTDGRAVWQVRLPGAKGPTLVGDEAILDADPSRDNVIVNVLGSNQRRQVIIRAKDGVKVSDAPYFGYFWRSGTHRAAGLILGYEGLPTGLSLRKYQRLLALREENGKLVWSLSLLPNGASPPTAVESSLLITNDDQLLHIDVKSGQVRWKVNLSGLIASDTDPPLVVSSRVVVAHTATHNRDDKQWQLSILRLADGKQEAQVDLYRSESESFSVLRRMGGLVIVASYFVTQIVDPQSARVLATLDFEKLLSRFVYSDPPSMYVADSDAQGFAVVTSDGKLRYFAAEDFRQSVGMPDIPLQKSQTEDRPGIFLSILFYLVVNPLWDLVLANRLTFWVMFYGFPFVLIGLIWAWKPLWARLRRTGVSRGGKWGGWIGSILALPAAIYRGLLGGIAAGFGSYGSFGPIWGGISGFGTFLTAGLLVGIMVGLLCAWLLHLGRAKRQNKAAS